MYVAALYGMGLSLDLVSANLPTIQKPSSSAPHCTDSLVGRCLPSSPTLPSHFHVPFMPLARSSSSLAGLGASILGGSAGLAGCAGAPGAPWANAGTAASVDPTATSTLHILM